MQALGDLSQVSLSNKTTFLADFRDSGGLDPGNETWRTLADLRERAFRRSDYELIKALVDATGSAPEPWSDADGASRTTALRVLHGLPPTR